MDPWGLYTGVLKGMGAHRNMTAVKSQRRRKILWWLSGLLIVVGVIANVMVWFRPFDARLEYPTYPATVISAGEVLYQASCSSCHGAEGEGNPAANVPALDASMHAWHHADSFYASQIQTGGIRMPAIAPEWSDEEVTAVLAYVKQWWEPRQRAFQHEVSLNNP